MAVPDGFTPRPGMPLRGRVRGLPGGRSEEPPDLRVSAVLEVLAGEPVAEVAHRWSVDVALLHRWVRAFTDAGTAAVTNRPEEHLARQRDRFLAAFAHEVRSPLTVAQGWVGLLLDDDLPADDVRASVHRLHEALGRLAERTFDVELLAAASLGLLRPRLERVGVTALVAALPDAVPSLGEAASEISVDVDPQLFPRVLRDLWWASSLAPAPRTRRLEVGLDGPWVELRVVREGDPIPPIALQALFEPFDLGDDASGVTIGLYLARALAVAHGGSIGVEQDDTQAALWVRVPLTRTTAADTPRQDVTEQHTTPTTPHPGDTP